MLMKRRPPVGPDVKFLGVGPSREDRIHTHLSVGEAFEPMVITYYPAGISSFKLIQSCQSALNVA